MNRWFARLGEHDVRTTRDGEHEDILITEKKPHPQWNEDLVINDVAVIKLQHDVTFSGTAKIFFFLKLPKFLIHFDIISLNSRTHINNLLAN